MKNKLLKTIATLCLSLISVFAICINVSAESVYQGNIGGNDVWHVTGEYHILHELEWIKFEKRNVNGGLAFVERQIDIALVANRLGRGYLKVIRHPDNKWTYEAVTWI